MSENVLTPSAAVVTIGSTNYEVGKFCLAKSMKMLSLLTDISEQAGISAVIAVAQSHGLITALADALPRIMGGLEPRLFQLLALILLPNKRLFEIVDRDQSVDEALKADAKALMQNEDLDIDKALEIIQVGYERIGLEALQRNFKSLLDKIAPPPDPAAETAATEESTTSG